MESKPGARSVDTLTRLRLTVEQFDPKVCRQLLRKIAAKGTYYVPTHVTREFDARASEPGYRDDPRLRYVEPAQRGRWKADIDRTANASAEEILWFRRYLQHGLDITAMAHKAGVKIMVGTDANDSLMIPGFRVHDEMELLAKAGLSPMDVLRAATTVPAEYTGMGALLGGIADGKLADLVLLKSDPLQAISNTRSISAVIIGGRLLDRVALDKMLEDLSTATSEYVVRRDPLPGSEDAVRRLISELTSGRPDYDRMSRGVADLIRKQLPEIQRLISDMGEVQSVSFKEADGGGVDVFRVTMANGSIDFGVRLDANRRVTSAILNSAAP